MVILAALPGIVRELLVTGKLVHPGNLGEIVNSLGSQLRKAGLGISGRPGGNILNVNGIGGFIHNTTPNMVSAAGDTFEVNGTPLPAPYLSYTALAASANP